MQRQAAIVRSRRRISQTQLLCAMLAGCAAAARPVDLTARPSFDERDVLEFTVHGRHVSLQSVRVAHDSVSGIPWQYSTDPRASYAIADVSQVMVDRAEGATGGLGRSILGVGLIVGLLVVIANSAMSGH